MTHQEVEVKLKELLPDAGESLSASKLNKINLNTVYLKLDDEGIEKFNEIYQLVSDWRELKLTKSGGISIKGRDFRWYSHKTVSTKSGCELIIVAPEKSYRIIIKRENTEQKKKIHGHTAFAEFKKRLEEKGFDISELAIENGLEVKQTIQKPDIRMIEEYKDKTVEHAFHVDINSAYMAGIKTAYGSAGNGILGEVINDIYINRKNPKYGQRNKDILNLSQGYFQSVYCVLNHHGYALAHLSKAGIEACYNGLQKLIAYYEKEGCKLIGTNTDGAWFEAPKDMEEWEVNRITSDRLGGCKVDHWDCTLRYKTRGAYEFIENGVYTPVVRGSTKLDQIKPRSEWKWGDIYRKEVKYEIVYFFKRGVGYVKEENIIESLSSLC